MTQPQVPNDLIAIIGGGPAGLMAAQMLAEAGLIRDGIGVTIYDRMPTLARKFLLAGRGGLNLTHAEPRTRFLERYGEAAPHLTPLLDAFPPPAVVAWCEALGQPTFIGSSGRVFPKAMNTSPLLRGWLAHLTGLGVRFVPRHRWTGWDASGAPIFEDSNGQIIALRPRATLLALGGASWPKLGADGGWVAILAGAGVELRPLQPANCGFEVAWTSVFRERFAGQPLKRIALTHGLTSVRGEAMITASGLEGGAVYELSATLRDAIARVGSAEFAVDLRPDLSHADLARRLAKPRAKQTLTNHIRKAASLAPAAVGLLRESCPDLAALDPDGLAVAIKAAPVRVLAARGIERAISSAGGIAFAAIDERLMLRARPGVFVAGEMIDWEAPTGGYLLQGCFSTGAAAARGMLDWLGRPSPPPSQLEW